MVPLVIAKMVLIESIKQKLLMILPLKLKVCRVDLGSKEEVRLATYEGLTKLCDLDTVGNGVDEVEPVRERGWSVLISSYLSQTTISWLCSRQLTALAQSVSPQMISVVLVSATMPASPAVMTFTVQQCMCEETTKEKPLARREHARLFGVVAHAQVQEYHHAH